MVTVVRLASDKETTCNNCKAVLSYNFRDIETYVSECARDGRDVSYSIICPACLSKTYVKRWQ